MLTPPKTPQDYCDRVAECQRLAAEASSPVREVMLYVALRWRAFADADGAGPAPFDTRGVGHMTIAAELYAEARRLREFSHTLGTGAVRAEILELIDELERRARAFRPEDQEVKDPARRPRLSDLTDDQVLGRAKAYRDLADTATTAWVQASLMQCAIGLERMVEARTKHAQVFPSLLTLVR
jgi:hypothetical protein